MNKPKRGKKPSKQDLENSRTAIWPSNGLCPLCGRPMIKGPSLNEHHLVPKSYGGSEKYVMHRTCHTKVHSLFSEADLAFVYNSFSALLGHPGIQSFVKWVRKQDPESTIKHRRPRMDMT